MKNYLLLMAVLFPLLRKEVLFLLVLGLSRGRYTKCIPKQQKKCYAASHPQESIFQYSLQSIKISKVQACLMMVVMKFICQNLYLKQNL